MSSIHYGVDHFARQLKVRASMTARRHSTPEKNVEYMLHASLAVLLLPCRARIAAAGQKRLRSRARSA